VSDDPTKNASDANETTGGPPAPHLAALTIAGGVRAGQRQARAVLEDHLARIEGAEGDVHAFNLLTVETARAAADRVDLAMARGEDPGPLAGVPIALKDNLCTRGVTTTCSSRILEHWVPPYDATVVQRVAGAGAIVVGKTNLDEFAMGSSTENSAFGPTRNPHNLARVPGGSSGGSAAAVAAGFAALGLGSDTGGSIRQPAALCGVVGVKPTYGLVSRYGLIAFASSLDQIGPLAHSVADAALLLDVISGPDPCDSTSLGDAPPSAAARLDAGVDGLRVGVVAELVSAEGIALDVVARTREAADALAAAGAKVDEVSVPAAVYGLSAYYLIAPAEASSNLARYDGVRYGLRLDGDEITEMYLRTRSAGFGAEVKRRIMLGTYALSAGYYDAYYGKAQQVRTLIIRDFEAAYRHFDVLLGPAAPTTAFAFGAKTADPLTMYLNDVCTIPSNLAGHPAMSVPFGTGDDGLPVGVQVLAPALGETVMFQVAAAVEAAAPALAAPPLARVREGGGS
jgi:aspartyl-tRNA(Asn)/glutamyl-tRNA(Gln) amidotransferase subunit A